MAEQSKAFLDGDIIFEVFIGHLTADDVNRVARSADPLIELLLEKEKSVRFLIDVSQVTDTDTAANLRTKHFLATRHFDKVAFFGVPSHLSVVANLIAKASGRRGAVHFFPDRPRAMEWLNAN